MSTANVLMTRREARHYELLAAQLEYRNTAPQLVKEYRELARFLDVEANKEEQDGKSQ